MAVVEEPVDGMHTLFYVRRNLMGYTWHQDMSKRHFEQSVEDQRASMAPCGESETTFQLRSRCKFL